MIETVLLTDIPFAPELPALLKKLRIDQRPEYADRFTRLLQSALPIARPKAGYGVASVGERGHADVQVDGVTLTSRVLRVNVAELRRVFPFVITCGVDMEGWARSITDMVERFWADAIMEESLEFALVKLKDDIARRYGIGHSGMMNPGSLEDWPLEQQRPLFDILGDVSGQIGVRLTDSFIMTPIKSASGLLFETQATYENCQMCPREACPNRRAPYDPGLYERQYSLH